MVLKPESQKLLITLAKECQDSPYGLGMGYTGALIAAKAGILPPEGAYRADYCTEGNCYEAERGLRELAAWGYIKLYSGKVRPVGLEGAWNWLFESGVYLTPEGAKYVERLSWPRYRNWWFKIPSDLRALLITILGVIIATLLLYYLLPS